MDEHPIPQNVTSFEFHLVGDMTLKQFGYLAGGAAVSYLIFLFLFPVSPVAAVPLIATFFLTGAAFAFLPISDRPLDHWLRAFLRAVYSPTQGYWKPAYLGKTHASPQDPAFNNRLQIYLNNISVGTVAAAPPILPPIPPSFLKPPNTKHQTPTPPAPPLRSLPSKEELNKLVEMARQVQTLKQKVATTEAELQQLKSSQTTPTQGQLSERQLRQMTGNLEGLINQTKEIYQKTTKDEAKRPSGKNQPVRVVTTPPAAQKQMQLTSTPNVINGVVTDTAGNLLESVIAIIHDKNNLPVRALKTNKLGQFAGATPLPSGIYTLSLEKEGLIFDTFQITLNGAVFPPLKIMPKRGGA